MNRTGLTRTLLWYAVEYSVLADFEGWPVLYLRTTTTLPEGPVRLRPGERNFLETVGNRAYRAAISEQNRRQGSTDNTVCHPRRRCLP